MKNAAIVAASDAADTEPARPPPPRRIPVKAGKKDVKSLLKGVVVKKKPKPEPVEKGKGEEPKMAFTILSQPGELGSKRGVEDEAEREGKKQRIVGTRHALA